MVDPHKVHLFTLSLTPRGLITYVCLWVINLHNFNHSIGKGNSKQHVSHFVQTCNNASMEGDLLVKQFVRSLQGNAFDWFIDLALECIDNCDKMEREFLNLFYNTL